MFDIVDIITTIIRTMVLLVRLIYDIIKDRKQKSNRPPKGFFLNFGCFTKKQVHEIPVFLYAYTSRF